MDSKYLLGISELDLQHTDIETDFIAFQQAIDDPHRRDELSGILEQLIEKLKFHFHAEESIMKIFAYPETREHGRSHYEILKSVETYRNRELSDADVEELRDQPLQLFLEQILSQDLRFSLFIAKSKDRLGIQ